MDDFLLEPWPKRVTELDARTVAAVRGVTTESGIRLNAERLEAYRVGLQEGRRMTTTPNLNGLTDAFSKFTQRVDNVAELALQGKFPESLEVDPDPEP